MYCMDNLKESERTVWKIFEEQAEIIEGQIRESESERKNIWEHSLRMPI